MSEYIHLLYQRKLPQYLGYDTVSALRRFHPGSKPALETAKVYLQNWNSLITRKKALPLSVDLARAFAALSLSEGKVEQGIFVLLTFLGLLRVQESLG